MPRLSAHYRQQSFLEACRAEFASSTVAGALLKVMKVSRSPPSFIMSFIMSLVSGDFNDRSTTQGTIRI